MGGVAGGYEDWGERRVEYLSILRREDGGERWGGGGDGAAGGWGSSNSIAGDHKLIILEFHAMPTTSTTCTVQSFYSQ